MGKYKKLLSNTAILGAGTFTSKVLVFLLMPLYTAILSTEEFGTADILQQTANLIIPLAALGISDGLFRFTLESNEQSRKRVFGNSLLIFAAGIIPLAALIQLLRLFSIYDGYIWLVMAYVCFANLHSICANYLRACDKAGIFALQGIINTVLTITLNVLFLVLFDMSVTGYVLSVALSDLIVTLGLIIFCKLYKEPELKFDRKLIAQMLKFSIPYIPTTLMWMITSASDRFIVTAYAGTAENGLYAAAYKLPTLISLAGGVFIEAWQFSAVKDAKEEECSQFFGEVYRNYIGIMFMGTSLLIAASKVLTVLLLDDAYYSSWQYVSVLGIAMIFSAFSAFMGSVYFLEKRSVRSLLTATFGAALNVVLNFLFIPKHSAMGAAVATAISYVAVYIIRACDSRRYLKFSLCVPRVIINTVILVAQTLIMLFETPYWIVWQIAIALFMLVFNGKEIAKTISTFLAKFLKKKEKNI